MVIRFVVASLDRKGTLQRSLRPAARSRFVGKAAISPSSTVKPVLSEVKIPQMPLFLRRADSYGAGFESLKRACAADLGRVTEVSQCAAAGMVAFVTDGATLIADQ